MNIDEMIDQNIKYSDKNAHTHSATIDLFYMI